MKTGQTRSTSTLAPLAAAVAAALALLAGCDTATKLNQPTAAAPVETRTAAPVGRTPNTGATSAATPQSSVATVDLNKTTGAAASTAAVAMPMQRVIYFDFDSYAIKDDYKSLVDVYARVLSGNRGKKLVVEGHTDERGGREYNLALGQKRAAAVVQSLTLLGATDVQLEAVSFGEERPAAQGNDESAWAKNRRAEIKDK